MTIGAKRVRLEFNPSKNSLVNEIKGKTAELIDLCEREVSGPEEARLWRLAQDAYEDAAMWAVKAATICLVALFMFADYAVAQQLTVTIQGTVNSANGSIEGTFGPVTLPVTVTPPPVQSMVTITSQAVDRPDAPAGTSRVLTVTATSSTGAALSAPLPTASGITFTPVAGQPAGTFKWSFVY